MPRKSRPGNKVLVMVFAFVVVPVTSHSQVDDFLIANILQQPLRRYFPAQSFCFG
jgi:hypothetical protein